MSELACLFLFNRAISLAWGQKAYFTILRFQYGLPLTFLGWPFCLGEILPPRTSSKKLNGQSAISTRLPTLQHPLEKQVTSSQELHSTGDFLHMHLHEPDFFWFTSNGFFKRPVLLKYWLLCPFSMRKPHAKVVPRKDYFTHLRTLKYAKRCAEWSAPTIARHIHSTSVLLGVTVTQRYDVPWDWLWDACHMAGVRWGSHCKGKKGLHYRFEQSARNPTVNLIHKFGNPLGIPHPSCTA